VKRLTVPGNQVIQVGELTLISALIFSAVSQAPLESVEVVWIKNGVEQELRTKTNIRGEAYENFRANAAGSMTIQAQIRDPKGKPFDSKQFVFTVVERP
jgi:hypothetical protein